MPTKENRRDMTKTKDIIIYNVHVAISLLITTRFFSLDSTYRIYLNGELRKVVISIIILCFIIVINVKIRMRKYKSFRLYQCACKK